MTRYYFYNTLINGIYCDQSLDMYFNGNRK